VITGATLMHRLPCLVVALAAALWTPLAPAQGFPDRPINVIVPFPPGIVDGYARLIGAKASPILGQPLVFRNQAGAGQRIGTDALAKSPKDGYTIGVVTNAGVVSGPTLAASVPYDPVRDLAYLNLVFESHYLINTHPGTGHRSLRTLVDAGKAAPGKLRFGSTGMGTGFHLATEQFVHTAGLKALHVPYRGESPLLVDLIGGQVDFAFSSVASRQMVEQGKLVALAYTGEKRHAALPDVPTAREAGIPHVSSGWLGFAMPAGVPAAVRDRLITALRTAASDPEVVERLAAGGGEPRTLDGDAFAARVKREIDELREFNKELKLTLD